MSVLVIAEIGGNHDGSLGQAFRLIDEAAVAGADAVKFQLFNPDMLYPGKHTEGSIPAAWLGPLDEHCDERGIMFGCSVFDLETLRIYAELGPSWVKIASPEATNLILVGAAARVAPLFLSTGAMDWAMLDRTMSILGEVDVTLLHCVSAYPAEAREMNLGVMQEMLFRYDVYNIDVGLSDHTTDDTIVPSFAVAAGATVIEKHFTLDRRSPGADHSFALEPRQFRSMVSNIRFAEEVLGDGVKVVQPSEDPTDRRPQ